jgi:hypothetical protein
VEFKPKNFERMVEQDVREDVITPLLHGLGYEQGSAHDIKRGTSLKIRVRSNYFGRPKKNAYELRGEADYILEAGGKVRWVSEAKSPQVLIDEEAVDQAYHYARHPEVRAVLFCLCNGRELKVYRTDYLPESSLLLSVPYEKFEEDFGVIVNVLSPEAMLRKWPEVLIDTGKPLGPGLGSLARVAAGTFRYNSLGVAGDSMAEFLFNVTGGTIQRDEDGKLVAYITTQSPFASAQELNARLGYDRMELVCDESSVSTDPEHPTAFRSRQQLVIPAGSRALGFTFPHTYVVDSMTVVEGHLAGNEFAGSFRFRMQYDKPLYVALGVTLQTVDGGGEFKIYVV